MLPVKPSITITSAAPSVTWVPSTLPMKFSPVPASPESCSCTVTSSGVPLPGSSPLDSSATRGEARPITAWANAEPMCANWTRCSGRQVTLAPDVEEQHRGRARHRDRQRQRRPVDPAIAAQVEQPGGEGRAGRAAGDQRLGTAVGHGLGGLDDRGLRGGADRKRRVGGLGDRDRARRRPRPRRGRLRSPPRDRTGSRGCRPARRSAAPAATSAGPRSAPPASTATVTIDAATQRVGSSAGAIDLTPAVAAADGADAVGSPGAVALRALVVGRCRDLVLGAALGRARVGLLLLGDGHRTAEASRRPGPCRAAPSGSGGRPLGGRRPRSSCVISSTGHGCPNRIPLRERDAVVAQEVELLLASRPPRR